MVKQELLANNDREDLFINRCPTLGYSVLSLPVNMNTFPIIMPHPSHTMNEP